MNNNKISDYKLFAILIDEILALKTKNAINEMVLEVLIQKNFPDSFEAFQVQLKVKVESLHALHLQELIELLHVESHESANDLRDLLSKLNL